MAHRHRVSVAASTYLLPGLFSVYPCNTRLQVLVKVLFRALGAKKSDYGDSPAHVMLGASVTSIEQVSTPPTQSPGPQLRQGV